MPKRHLFIGMPVGKSSGIEVITLESLHRAEKALDVLGIRMEVRFTRGGMLHMARNLIIAEFLKSEATDFLFIDSDLGFTVRDFLRFISHPLTDKEMVCGLYRMPHEPESYTVNHLGGIDCGEVNAETGLMEVTGIPLGFSRMTRPALERMIEAYAARKYQKCYAHDMDAWSLYSFEFKNGADYGEDMVFCERWRAIGGKIWIDPDIYFKHMGPQVYEGEYGTYHRAGKKDVGYGPPPSVPVLDPHIARIVSSIDKTLVALSLVKPIEDAA